MKKLILVITCIFFLIAAADIFSQNMLKWRTIPTITNPLPQVRFTDMSFINENTGWVIRGLTINNLSYNNVFRTTNGGVSWTMFPDTSKKGLRSVGFADSLNGWLGSLSIPGPIMYNTTNGGADWTPAITSSMSDSLGVCGISVVNKNVVYGCGRYFGPAKVFKTTNGGLNWSIIDMSNYITTLIDCHFFNKDSGFVVGGIGSSFEARSGAVLFTSDGGATWVNRITTPPRGQWCWKISFPDRMNGYVSLEMNSSSPVYFLKTTDGGETWTEKVFLNTYADEEGIGFINANTGWIGGWFFYTYKTTDGGETWNSDPWGYNLNRIRYVNDSVSYGIGSGVYKYSTDTIVNISQINSIVPVEFSLAQNFPNPFNPKTIINYELGITNDVELKVYDVLGNEVVTLVNEKQNAGTYSVEFDGSGFASGVYFYKLEAGDFVYTKRMVLLK